MPYSQTYNVTQASQVTNTLTGAVTLAINYQPLPSAVGSGQVTSPFTGQISIPSPTAAQIAKYTATGAQITLTTDT